MIARMNETGTFGRRSILIGPCRSRVRRAWRRDGTLCGALGGTSLVISLEAHGRGQEMYRQMVDRHATMRTV